MFGSFQIPPSHRLLLGSFGINAPILLGKGMQSMVYDFGQDKIIKIYIDPNINLERIKELSNFYQKIKWQSDNVVIPQIFDLDNLDGLFFSIERKLRGEKANALFLTSDPKVKVNLLNSYFSLLNDLQQIDITDDYGEQLTGQLPKINSHDWRVVIKRKLEQSRDKALTKPDHDIGHISRLFEKYFQENLPKVNPLPAKSLVHGDLFFENVLANKEGEVVALLDFSPLTQIGDHLMDVAGLVYFPTVSENITEEVTDYLKQLACKKYPGKQEELDNYLLYYSLFFINSKKYDPQTYAWCLKNLAAHGYLDSQHKQKVIS